MSLTFRAAGLAALVAACALTLSAPARAENGRNGAAAAGLAVGLVGGVLLDRTLLRPSQPQAQPVYVDPQPTYSVRRPAPDVYYTRASGLKAQCDEGDTSACIRFGIQIGQHKEREAQWRRQHPDMFDYERN